MPGARNPRSADDPKKGAPAYLVGYCSIFTLLLAFFIILQSFASAQRAGLFHAGQGSFVRALETFGLGGVWEDSGGPMRGGQPAPRYMATEGQDDPSDLPRIDPDAEEAQRAMAALQEFYDVSQPAKGAGWRVSLPTPFAARAWDGTFSEEESQWCHELAQRLEPVMLARGFVVRVGTVLQTPDQREAQSTLTALAAANQVRDKLLESMDPATRQIAAGRLYSYCRRETAADGQSAAPEAQLRVDILLTKPFTESMEREEIGTNETQKAR